MSIIFTSAVFWNRSDKPKGRTKKVALPISWMSGYIKDPGSWFRNPLLFQFLRVTAAVLKIGSKMVILL